MENIVMPDFEAWANGILINVKVLGGIPATQFSVEVALKQAFEQGYALGRRAEQEWWEAVDADPAYMEEFGVFEQQITDAQVKRLTALTKDVIINLDEPLEDD